ncbi:MAG: hypothetical protein IMZ62_07610 [Chloroflexi bacterium]|nr:hypothetical protein [Chloroflexota bacterium]
MTPTIESLRKLEAAARERAAEINRKFKELHVVSPLADMPDTADALRLALDALELVYTQPDYWLSQAAERIGKQDG